LTFSGWLARCRQSLKSPATTTGSPSGSALAARTFPVRFPLLRLDRIYVKNAHASSPTALALLRSPRSAGHGRKDVASSVTPAPSGCWHAHFSRRCGAERGDPLMKCTWQEGNRITLLENGDNFYPAVFEALSGAWSERCRQFSNASAVGLLACAFFT
jgi:hypothetical protein